MRKMHGINKVLYCCAKCEVGACRSVIRKACSKSRRVMVTLPVADEHANRLLRTNERISPFAQEHEREVLRGVRTAKQIAVDLYVDKLHAVKRQNICQLPEDCHARPEISPAFAILLSMTDRRSMEFCRAR